MAHANGWYQDVSVNAPPLHLSEDIRAARRRMGLTQQQVAHRVGITVRSVSGWERGKAIPHQVTLEALARALGQEPKRFVATAQLMASRRRAARVGQVAPRIQDALSEMAHQLRTGD